MEQPNFLFLCLLLTCCVYINHGRYVEHMQQTDWGSRPSQSQSSEDAAGSLSFRFASYYSSHMVLQQAPRAAVVWGFYPDVGDRIIIKVSGPAGNYTRGAVVRGGGVWSVTLDPTPSGGPYSIDAYADNGGHISITDVLFGDVWVCSGQSNMQFSTDQIFNASKELNESSQYSQIRVFTAALETSTVPLSDLKSVAEPWSLPSATTLGHKPFTYFSAVCWLWGKLLYKERGYPMGLIDTTWGGTPVEAWSSPAALQRCGIKDQPGQPHDSVPKTYTKLEGPSDNSALWNAMVHPFLNMTIYGAIWYQGEADRGVPNVNHYNCTFPSMIDDWRDRFSAASQQTSPLFPFGFVQLAAWEPDRMISVGFPDIRWHQTADYGYVPNPRMKDVFMAVAMDLPDFPSPYGSIHPRDKQDVAARMLMSGVPVAYNSSLPPVHGPRPLSISQLGPGQPVVLSYSTDAADYITLRSHEGFDFCCPWSGTDDCHPTNSWWVPSPVLSFNQTAVVLDGSVCGGQGQPITGLRYAWRESPCAFKLCGVYSLQRENLPAPPFITLKPVGSGPSFTYTIDWSKPTLIP